MATNGILLVIVLSIVIDDVEETELVNTLRSGYNTEPVTELVLLEELLCPKRSNKISLIL
jgi:hypothetical protein